MVFVSCNALKYLIEIGLTPKFPIAFSMRLEESANILTWQEHAIRRKAAPNEEYIQNERSQSRRLNEERLPKKSQKRKTIYTSAPLAVNVSRQNQKVTGFSVENLGNRCMNPATCIGCLLIHVETIKRERATRKWDS
jgi:hypothetical protein